VTSNLLERLIEQQYVELTDSRLSGPRATDKQNGFLVLEASTDQTKESLERLGGSDTLEISYVDEAPLAGKETVGGGESAFSLRMTPTRRERPPRAAYGIEEEIAEVPEEGLALQTGGTGDGVLSSHAYRGFG
jgi:hypothetical protein